MHLNCEFMHRFYLGRCLYNDRYRNAIAYLNKKKKWKCKINKLRQSTIAGHSMCTAPLCWMLSECNVQCAYKRRPATNAIMSTTNVSVHIFIRFWQQQIGCKCVRVFVYACIWMNICRIHIWGEALTWKGIYCIFGPFICVCKIFTIQLERNESWRTINWAFIFGYCSNACVNICIHLSMHDAWQRGSATVWFKCMFSHAYRRTLTQAII